MAFAAQQLRRPLSDRPVLKHIRHESFLSDSAESQFASDSTVDPRSYETSHMPDEVTRDIAGRMHYAAYRAGKARRASEELRWRERYYLLRDQIVVGNRKLAYRAVRKRMSYVNQADDLIAECHIVLIHAVAAYNPWMGIRFSTYAFTCLVRALSRLSQRMSNDWLSRSLPLEMLADDEPGNEAHNEFARFPQLQEFLRPEHPLLTPREKMILGRRYNFFQLAGTQTLQRVGHDMGLSKERVRQVQASALDKLRKALAGASMD